MASENLDSVMKETLKSICCCNGWCYGVIWGFDQINSLLLTLKDAYYEEQMGALIDSMLLQAHFVGRGVIGHAAFAKNYRWIDSDAHIQRQNFVASFNNLDVFQEDFEFLCQFSMGIKTVAVISVEPWGVIELGSIQKIPEIKNIIDQVQQIFRRMNGNLEIEGLINQPHLDSQFFHSNMELDSSLSNSIFDSKGFVGADYSFVVPSQPFSSIEDPIQSGSNPIEQLLLESSNFFDCSATHQDSSWPQMASGLESSKNSSFNNEVDLSSTSFHGQQFLKDVLSRQNFGSSISTEEFKARKLSGLLTVEEFSMQSNSANVLNDLVSKDMSHSLQSSVTHAFRSSDDVKLGVELGGEKAIVSNDRNVGSKICSSNSLFSKLGLDHLLNGVSSASPSYDTSRFEDMSSSAAKRRKLNTSSWSQNQVKFEGPSFDGKTKSTVAKNIEVKSEDSMKEPQSCIDDDAGKPSSSMRQEEGVKTKKKKAKPGTRPRPKDRQMIQDRLEELRQLIPNGVKLSIDRLLEGTIRHLNFMQGLTRHAESFKQTAKTKSMEFRKNHSINGGDGVTWACEIGDDAMVCPLIVEDLNTPGQMLIEILCEEQGFFLEIVEIIRSFGLTILKGEMEIHEAKIWAHFMVESEKTRVTRHEIFSSLIQLLQVTGQSAGNSYESVIRTNMPNFSNFQPTSSSFDVLQCANL